MVQVSITQFTKCTNRSTNMQTKLKEKGRTTNMYVNKVIQ